MGYRAHCLPCIGKPVFHLVLVTIHPDIHDILSNKKKNSLGKSILAIMVALVSATWYWWWWYFCDVPRSVSNLQIFLTKFIFT